LLPERAADRTNSQQRQRQRIGRMLPLMASKQQRKVFELRPSGLDAEIAVDGSVQAYAPTRPMLGRRPTMPQKLAGLRSEPPMSEPWASQAMPVAAPRLRRESRRRTRSVPGLRVAPNTH